jgi:phosphatidylglycerol:prolipoprotein diacylglycerol transferase
VLPAGIDRLGHRVTQFDTTTPLHPTPIYELLLGVTGFVILLAIRRKPLPDGMVFMIYLLLASTFRFVVEFWRLNPKLIGGFSEAQVLAIALFCTGLAGLVLVARRRGKAGPAA